MHAIASRRGLLLGVRTFPVDFSCLHEVEIQACLLDVFLQTPNGQRWQSLQSFYVAHSYAKIHAFLEYKPALPHQRGVYYDLWFRALNLGML